MKTHAILFGTLLGVVIGALPGVAMLLLGGSVAADAEPVAFGILLMAIGFGTLLGGMIGCIVGILIFRRQMNRSR